LCISGKDRDAVAIPDPENEKPQLKAGVIIRPLCRFFSFPRLDACTSRIKNIKIIQAYMQAWKPINFGGNTNSESQCCILYSAAEDFLEKQLDQRHTRDNQQ
jgi:hypothetical protein